MKFADILKLYNRLVDLGVKYPKETLFYRQISNYISNTYRDGKTLYYSIKEGTIHTYRGDLSVDYMHSPKFRLSLNSSDEEIEDIARLTEELISYYRKRKCILMTMKKMSKGKRK